MNFLVKHLYEVESSIINLLWNTQLKCKILNFSLAFIHFSTLNPIRTIIWILVFKLLNFYSSTMLRFIVLKESKAHTPPPPTYKPSPWGMLFFIFLSGSIRLSHPYTVCGSYTICINNALPNFVYFFSFK